MAKKRRHKKKLKYFGRKERLKRQLETVNTEKQMMSKQMSLLTKKNDCLKRSVSKSVLLITESLNGASNFNSSRTLPLHAGYHGGEGSGVQAPCTDYKSYQHGIVLLLSIPGHCCSIKPILVFM